MSFLEKASSIQLIHSFGFSNSVSWDIVIMYRKVHRKKKEIIRSKDFVNLKIIASSNITSITQKHALGHFAST